MTELKTLKDIDLKKRRENIYDGEMDIKNILKDEAVKSLHSDRIKHMSASDFIICFFNLTEENLK